MTPRFLSLLTLLCFGTVLVACGDDDTMADAGEDVGDDSGSDSGTDSATDMGGTDADMDGGTDADMDGGTDADMDGGTDADMDGGTDADMDGGTDADMDGGTDADMDAGPNPTSAEIEVIRMTAEGTHDPELPVTDGIVSYVRGLIGSDPAGFFVQAEQMGPALYVAVDPTTLDPEPAVGDTVSFGVTETELVGDQVRATSIIDFARSDEGFDVSTLVQDLSAADDVVSGLDSYASELVTATGTLTDDGGFAGTDHTGFAINTEGIMDDEDLLLRTPTVVAEALELGMGCTLTAGPAPMWRFTDTAQFAAFLESEITEVSCPAPTLLSAVAPNDTTVRLTFSWPLEAIEIEDIAIAAGLETLTVTAVSLDGAVATLTTESQTLDTVYTVEVNDVVDTRGTDIDADMNTAMFTGSAPAPAPLAGDLVITEIFYDDGVAGSDDELEWVEIFNPSEDTTYQLLDCEIDDIADGGGDPLVITDSVRIGPGEYIVLGGEMTETEAAFGFGPSLNNTGDSVILRCGETDIDEVDYDAAGFASATGASLQLAGGVGDAEANDEGANWCVTSDASGYGTRGYFGTPGAMNESCPGGALFITEVIEGSGGGNKAVELTNRGMAPLDLAACTLSRHSNGVRVSTAIVTLDDFGALLAGESFTICNSGVGDEVACDLRTGTINHNGNDAYSLRCDDVVVDSFGDADLDTGTSSHPNFTGTGGLSGANQTLIRQCDVAVGDTDLTDVEDLADEWERLSDMLDDYSNFGCDCDSCTVID